MHPDGWWRICMLTRRGCQNSPRYWESPIHRNALGNLFELNWRTTSRASKEIIAGAYGTRNQPTGIPCSWAWSNTHVLRHEVNSKLAIAFCNTAGDWKKTSSSHYFRSHIRNFPPNPWPLTYKEFFSTTTWSLVLTNPEQLGNHEGMVHSHFERQKRILSKSFQITFLPPFS